MVARDLAPRYQTQVPVSRQLSEPFVGVRPARFEGANMHNWQISRLTGLKRGVALTAGQPLLVEERLAVASPSGEHWLTSSQCHPTFLLTTFVVSDD